jgi:hypothetical protein
MTASNLSGKELKLEANGASSIIVYGSVTNLERTFRGQPSSMDIASYPNRQVSLNGASYADVTVAETLNASFQE